MTSSAIAPEAQRQLRHTYHEKIYLGRWLILMRCEYLGTFEITGQRSAEVCIVKRPQVFWLCSIRGPNLSRLDS